MNSSSSAILRNRNLKHSNQHETEEYNFLNALLWTLTSILVSCNVEMAVNNMGVVISASVFNVLLTLISTLLLWKGLRKNNAALVIPWVVISIWGMYYIQWHDIAKLFKLMLHYKIEDKLAWMALLAYFIALLLKIHLTICVARIALQQWFNKLFKSTNASTQEIRRNALQ